MNHNDRTSVYRVDMEDHIVFVNDAWRHFAEENCAEGLCDSSILGRSLWEFISDPETRGIYQMLFHRVRQYGSVLQLPFRCDAPDERRHMRLTLTRGQDNGIELSVSTLRHEPRPAVSLLDPAVPRAEQLLHICSWCKRVEVEGQWLEVEDAVSALQLFEHAPVPGLSHGICHYCLRGMGADE